MQVFLLLGRPRSGTTMLQTALDGHPQICCAGEVFHWNQKARDRHIQKAGIKCKWGGQPSTVNGYLKDILIHAKKKYSIFGIKVVGDEIYYGDLKFCKEQDPRFSYVFIYRDILDQFASLEQARFSNV